MRIEFGTLETPVGPVAVAWTGSTVLAIQMEEANDRRGWNESYTAGTPEQRMKRDLRKRFAAATFERKDAAPPLRAIGAYFNGDARAIDGLRVDPGGTDFQKRIWGGLRRIPAGSTKTYGELAELAGSPGAARAAGGAVGANPIPIVIPCHRIIGADRRLTGFGGGLARKKWLLEHEGAAFRAR